MQHPSAQLPVDIINNLRKYSAEAEAMGRLHDDQLMIIDRQQWFYLFVPKNYGGLNTSLPEAVRLEEALAWTDGSVGWVVTLCAGAGLFVGYFDEKLAGEVFTGEYTCIAGSGQANGTAAVTEEGYTVNGTWPYASGAPHATHFTGNCVITENGKPVIQANGKPLVRSFIFLKKEVSIHSNWKYIGLNATAGHSYSVNNLQVPLNRAFIIDAAHTKLPEPIYRYPFLQLAETTIAANISGMGLCFIELAREMLLKKQPGYDRAAAVKSKALERAEKPLEEMDRVRNAFYDILDQSWEIHLDGQTIPEEILVEIGKKSRQLARTALKLVNELYPYCGLDAARTDTSINLVWRNINTASQHTLLLSV